MFATRALALQHALNLGLQKLLDVVRLNGLETSWLEYYSAKSGGSRLPFENMNKVLRAWFSLTLGDFKIEASYIVQNKESM